MQSMSTTGRRATIAACAVALALTGTAVVQASTGSPPPSNIVSVTPYRVLDTRNGVGAPAGALGPAQTITVQIAGAGPVPASATGVVVNLTATQGTSPGYVTAWPTGEPRPDTSVLNILPGQDTPNTVTLALGAGGRLDLFNFTGSVHLLADVVGYLVPEAQRPAITARRVDTLSTARKVIAVDLPAGAWALSAHVGGSNTTTLATRIECTLLDHQDAEVDFSKDRVTGGAAPAAAFFDLSLQGAVGLDEPGSASVRCVSTAGHLLELTSVVLTAVPADAVSVQSGDPA